MKIKQAHFERLKTEIDKMLATHNSDGQLVDFYQSGDFHNADKTKDVNRRFCFDVLFGAGLTEWICSELYPYLNDDHIYTALKAICPKIETEKLKRK